MVTRASHNDTFALSVLERVGHHEAAHAVCALHLGMQVETVWIDADGSGQTDAIVDNAEHFAIVAVAGKLFERTYLEPRYPTHPFDSYADSFDMLVALAEVGVDRVWQAEDEAREILEKREPYILSVAARIINGRRLVRPFGYLAARSIGGLRHFR